MYQTKRFNSSQQNDKQPHSAGLLKNIRGWKGRAWTSLRGQLWGLHRPPRSIMISGMQSAGDKQTGREWCPDTSAVHGGSKWLNHNVDKYRLILTLNMDYIKIIEADVQDLIWWDYFILFLSFALKYSSSFGIKDIKWTRLFENSYFSIQPWLQNSVKLNERKRGGKDKGKQRREGKEGREGKRGKARREEPCWREQLSMQAIAVCCTTGPLFQIAEP